MPSKVCTPFPIRGVFSPRSKVEIKVAVDAYLKRSARGDGYGGLNGSIGEWNVSRITDMSRMFAGAESFNDDILKWNVSRVTDMSRMFVSASSFDGDISKWDVFFLYHFFVYLSRNILCARVYKISKIS